MDINSWLKQCPIVAILRGVEPHEVVAICSALEESGVAIVEVPLNSPRPLESIGLLSAEFGDRMLVGAGTLTHPDQVQEVAAVGGKLIVTPHADLDIVRAAKAAGLFAAPGFSNPTEAFALLRAGADVLKLFPSEVFGIPMLKALKAVLPKDSGIVPVGGIDHTNISTWMAAGAVGVGVGSSIYKPKDTPETVRQKANALMQGLES